MHNLCRMAVVLVAALALPTFAAEVPDFKQIKKFGMFANASYESRETIQKVATLYGYTLEHAGVLPDVQLMYFLLTAAEEKTQLIVIRGTANAENAMVDVAIKFTQDQRTGIRLHEGFAYSANALLKDLSPYLKRDYRLSTTGHSLGGAVAIIVAMYLDAEHFTMGPVITFGQPKVTNIPGAAKYSHLPILRVVTQGDLVPLVPPLDPLDLNNIDVYWHLGDEVILLSGKGYSKIGAAKSMLRATKIFGKPIDASNLQDHQMINYLTLLEDKQQGSQETVYENNFNLFNLFGN